MNKEIVTRWIAALRSGEYKQGKMRLHGIEDGVHTFCCLGVLCDLAEKEGVATSFSEYPGEIRYTGTTRVNGSSCAYLPEDIQNWAGLKNYVGGYENPDGSISSLVHMNDSGKTFNEIADFIENNQELLFGE